MPKRRQSPVTLKIGELFSMSQSGQSSGPGDFGFYDPDPGPPDDGGVVHGIQTQDGQDIEDQGGTVIQAEEQ